jgi:hypothetical protein
MSGKDSSVSKQLITGNEHNAGMAGMQSAIYIIVYTRGEGEKSEYECERVYEKGL